MNSVRSRIEARELASKYAARLTPQLPAKSSEEVERERRERLKASAAAIREQNLNFLLLTGDATPQELEAVKILISRECPQHLANADVHRSRLMRLRTEGQTAIDTVFGILDADVRAEAEKILSMKDALAVTGADGGAGARAAVAEYFSR